MRCIHIKNTDSNLPVGTLQKFLDKYLAENGGKIDYIHGNDAVKSLAAQISLQRFTVDSQKTTTQRYRVITHSKLFIGGAAEILSECKKIRGQ